MTDVPATGNLRGDRPRTPGSRFRHGATVAAVIIVIGVFLSLSAPPLQALTSDRDKPIELEADQAELDESRGVSIYTGNVVVVQGTMRLSGDKVTVYTVDGSPQRLVTEGNPARFRQRPDGKSEDVIATAKELEHLVSEDLLKLRGDALVIQDGDEFQGDRMEYHIATDKLNASTDEGSTSRVKITLQPRTQSGAGGDN